MVMQRYSGCGKGYNRGKGGVEGVQQKYSGHGKGYNRGTVVVSRGTTQLPTIQQVTGSYCYQRRHLFHKTYLPLKLMPNLQIHDTEYPLE